ncbi:MAG: DUF4858 domain-containing protein [Tannerellaceae bacterium]|nr:DUF4858 domain-containing protein [Tannerellaceae bacterium]
MVKRLLFLLVFCTQYTYSQWTKEDSLWLQDVLSGRSELHLNPETWKAIESGTLINTEHNASRKGELNPFSLRSFITKDFSEYLRPLENEKSINPFSIPPAVFIRQGLDKWPLPEDKINKAAFLTPQHIKDRAAHPSGKSFGDVLNYLFIPSERAKIRNREKANAWKTY